MKKTTKTTKTTIALAAAVLLLSGTFAAAADRVDVKQAAAGNATASQGRTANPVNVAAGVIEDIDQTDQQGGGDRDEPVCQDKVSTLQSFMEPLICLMSGNTMCLHSDLDVGPTPKCGN